MFRSTKKRPIATAQRIRLQTSQDEDDDEDATGIGALNRVDRTSSKKLSKLKSRTVVTRSFDDKLDDDGKPSKRRKGRGLGYGGGFNAVDESNNVEDDRGERSAPISSSSAYDKESLAKLLDEQRAALVPPQPAVDDDDAVVVMAPYNDMAVNKRATQNNSRDSFDGPKQNLLNTASLAPQHDSVPSEDFLAFSSTNVHNESPPILTGDEALSFVQRLEKGENDSFRGITHGDQNADDAEIQEYLARKKEQPSMEDSGAEDNWEAQVTRHAGVVSKNNPSSSLTAEPMPSAIHADLDSTTIRQRSGKPIAVLDQLRAQIQETLEPKQQSGMKQKSQRHNPPWNFTNHGARD
jgi:hypothetical protein